MPQAVHVTLWIALHPFYAAASAASAAAGVRVRGSWLHHHSPSSIAVISLQRARQCVGLNKC